MEERNVGTKGKNLKQGLTSTKDLARQNYIYLVIMELDTTNVRQNI